jgi:hypothetical protein
MPTKKPRITITLEPHAHEVLARLSAASGDSMSEIVAGFVDLAIPSLERVVVVLERAKAAPQEVRAGLASALDRADRALMPALVAAMDQNDLFLSDVILASQPQTPAPAPAGQPAAAAGKGRKGDSTPVPVTRGSGGTRKGVKGAANGSV